MTELVVPEEWDVAIYTDAYNLAKASEDGIEIENPFAPGSHQNNSWAAGWAAGNVVVPEGTKKKTDDTKRKWRDEA